MTSKRYKKLNEKNEELNSELIEKLIPKVKQNCTTKFDESIDSSNFVVQFFLTIFNKFSIVSCFNFLVSWGKALYLLEIIEFTP